MSLFTTLQPFLPKHGLSRFGGHVANARLEVAQWIIRRFIATYDVDLQDAVYTEPSAYPTFNAFFTRKLRPETRPIDGSSDVLVSPCDGSLGAHGQITSGRLIQAKGHSYALAELLADQTYAGQFDGGTFATIYLAPKDYHRVHCPANAQLNRADYIRGRLFSVNADTEQAIPHLFARNERLVCRLQSAAGPVALVMVGALVVAGIRTAWGDARAGSAGQGYASTRGPRHFDKGAEIGHFELGSTVILCMPPGSFGMLESLSEGTNLRMGQALARKI